MDEADEELIAQELAEVTLRITPNRWFPGVRTLALRTQRMAVRRLATETVREELTLPPSADRDDVLATCRATLETLGRILPARGIDDQGEPVRGLVGAGLMDKNLAIVTIELTAPGLKLTAEAKEGLIKQDSARKAMEKTLDAMRSRFGTGS